jgi:hypothetical protein
MDERLKALRMCFNQLFGEDIYNKCYIEVTNNGEIVISANREGLLLLIDEFIALCEDIQPGKHYHLDEAGMAYKCDKPLVIQVMHAPWEL